MILYESDAKTFRETVDKNAIVSTLEQAFFDKFGHTVSHQEKESWHNSLRYMETVIRRSAIPDDSGILLEYNIPASSMRIDFIVAGRDEADNANFVIVELKQWETATATDKDKLVHTYTGRGLRDVTHPSYQAFSYKQHLRDLNEALFTKHIEPYSCSYLHNYVKKNPEPLLAPQYADIYADTPIFFSEDVEKLEAFIKKYVSKGRGMDIIYDIDHGKIKPSKKFVDFVSDMFVGNKVYTLFDEQQVAYAEIMKYAMDTSKRTTIVVDGGPGTGKSVVAMNAFVGLLQAKKNVRFVAPNASFKEAIVDTLAKHKRETRKRLNAIFSGSMGYCEAPDGFFDVLIVDEAHRLKGKGTYMYRGESQVDDVIRSSKVNVFFIDDRQQVRPNDEGSVKKITDVAGKYGSQVIFVKLKAQFRCAGAEGFVNWVDNTLQIAQTANFDGWDKESFEFKIVDDPNELARIVEAKNKEHCRARMLAGFAWPWTSEKEGNADAGVADVTIPEFNFARPWNSRSDQYTWGIDDTRQNQIGCIHTSQGLEFDYVGVIIGNDLIFNPATRKVEAVYDEYYDKAGKKGLKSKPEKLTEYVKNIYRVLLSRGMKGCFVYCRNKDLGDYFKKRLGK